MGSIRKQLELSMSAEDVWDAVRDFGAPHERVVRGFVTDTRLDGNERIVTFVNGAVQREPLVACDDAARRLVYAAIDSPLGATHYNAAVTVQERETAGATLVWHVDFLPDDIGPALDAAMERGAQAMRETLAPAPA